MDEDEKDLRILFQNDPVAKAAKFDSQDLDFEIRKYPKAESDNYIFVESIVFQFIPDYSRPLIKVRERGKDELFAILIRGTRCVIKITSIDSEIVE